MAQTQEYKVLIQESLGALEATLNAAAKDGYTVVTVLNYDGLHVGVILVRPFQVGFAEPPNS
jgi:hypothetical protein